MYIRQRVALAPTGRGVSPVDQDRAGETSHRVKPLDLRALPPRNGR